MTSSYASFKPSLTIKEQGIVTCEGRAARNHSSVGRVNNEHYPFNNLNLSILQGDLLFYYGSTSSKAIDHTDTHVHQVMKMNIKTPGGRGRRSTNCIFSMFNGLDTNMTVYFAGVARTANYWKRGLTSILLQATEVNDDGKVQRVSARQGQLLCVRKPTVKYSMKNAGHNNQGADGRLLCEQYLIDPANVQEEGRNYLAQATANMLKDIAHKKDEYDKDELAFLRTKLSPTLPHDNEIEIYLATFMNSENSKTDELLKFLRGTFVRIISSSDTGTDSKARFLSFVYLRAFLNCVAKKNAKATSFTSMTVTALIESAFDTGLSYMLQQNEHMVVGMIMSSFAKTNEMVDIFIGHRN
jgi:hypothetical protein